MPAKKPPAKRSVSTKFKSALAAISKSRKLQILIVAGLFAVMGGAYVALSSAAVATVPVYRMNSSALTDYYYTTVTAEYEALPGYGYAKEGIGFYAWGDNADGRVPVYQLIFNPGGGGGGRHYFTTQTSEKDALANFGWKQERIAFYAYPAAGAGRAAVHIVYNDANAQRLLTISTAEKDSWVAKGWKYQGVAFYASEQAPVTNANKPIGNVDRNDCQSVGGWTLDLDNKSKSTEVHIYIDGTGFNVGATTVARPDVNATYTATGNHGFNWTVPAKYRDGKAHTVDVYAINVDSTGKLSGENSKVGSKAWACKETTTSNGSSSGTPTVTNVAIGTCVTSRTTTGACTEAESKAQAAFFESLKTETCVAIDGVTIVKCAPDEHAKQVATGALLEKGCVGATLDGTNRIDCSPITKAAQDAFFRGLAAKVGVTVARTSTSSGGSTYTGPSAADLNKIIIGAYGSTLASTQSSTRGACVMWYYPSYNPSAGWRSNNYSGMTRPECEYYYSMAPNEAFSYEYRNAQNQTRTANRFKNHLDWNGSKIR